MWASYKKQKEASDKVKNNLYSTKIYNVSMVQ